MAESLRQRVINFLIENRGVDRSKLETALKSSKAGDRSFGQFLVEEGLVSQKDLLETLAQGLQIPPINLARYQVDPELASLIPERMAHQYRVVPVSKIGNTLTVAMVDPLNILALDDLSLRTSLTINPVLAAEKDIEETLKQLYKPKSASSENFSPLQEGESDAGIDVESARLVEAEDIVDLTSLGKGGQKAPIIKVVNMMITEAIRSRASDIHVEPYEDFVRIRYRVDGALSEAFRLPKKNQNTLVTRLKIMSRLDITENRLPQDGRFKVRSDKNEIDFRVSVLPITFGNKVVLRLLDKANLSAGIDQLGFLPGSTAAFQKAITRPYGMILVTGPTGSGKSTTLYSVLAQMNEPGKNIVTVEDPVEYQLDGVTQVQVNPEIGLTFASTLRAFLRQAPDVVLVGEIRDGETADIAIKASLTGQIVLATLHTNDAPSAVTRLIDMGVDPFLLASSLIFVAAQRLCRELCGRCKVKDEVGPAVLKELGAELSEEKVIYRPGGCPHCKNVGFRGRFAILEAMLVDDKIREMIIAKAPPADMKAYAVAHGMRTLRQEGLQHCIGGRTSVDEVLRVTGGE